MPLVYHVVQGWCHMGRLSSDPLWLMHLKACSTSLSGHSSVEKARVRSVENTGELRSAACGPTS